MNQITIIRSKPNESFARSLVALISIVALARSLQLCSASMRRRANCKEATHEHRHAKARLTADFDQEVEFHQPPATPNQGRQLNNTHDKACSTAMIELDRCSSQLIGLGRQQSGALVFPGTMHDLEGEFCPEFKKSVDCVRNNSNCLKPFEKQIINWILSSTRRINYKRCKNTKEKMRFLRLTNSCLGSMRDQMDECMVSYIGSLDAIANGGRPTGGRALEFERLQEEGDDLQIQLSCCANKRFKRCMMKEAKRMCKPNEEVQNQLKRTNSNSSQRNARMQVILTIDNWSETRVFEKGAALMWAPERSVETNPSKSLFHLRLPL